MSEDIVNARKTYNDDSSCNIDTRTTQGRANVGKRASVKFRANVEPISLCPALYQPYEVFFTIKFTRRNEKALIPKIFQVLCGNLILEEGDYAIGFYFFLTMPLRS